MVISGTLEVQEQLFICPFYSLFDKKSLPISVLFPQNFLQVSEETLRLWILS